MMYYGAPKSLDSDKNRFQFKGDKIVVLQQYCAGENHVVFKDYVKENRKGNECAPFPY